MLGREALQRVAQRIIDERAARQHHDRHAGCEERRRVDAHCLVRRGLHDDVGLCVEEILQTGHERNPECLG